MRVALLACLLLSTFLPAQRSITLGAEELRARLGFKSTNVTLPLPDGKTATFTARYDPVMEPALAARYPQLASYRVEGPWGSGRIALSHKGVDALLRGPEGTFAIEPTDEADRHLIFYSSDYGDSGLPFACGHVEDLYTDEGDRFGAAAGANFSHKHKQNTPRELRVYDLALTNTGEFAQQVGGSKEDVLAAFNTAVSTVNAIFEREVAVRMNLLAISEDLIYLDPNTDPFVDADQGRELLSQVIEAFRDNNIPDAGYDLGHIFTRGCSDVGGVVSGLACTDGKTRGVTCLQRNNVARTAERIMAHELAHQFAVSHSWNNCPPNQGQRAGQTAFEPGSGTTIMSYAGVCGDQNIGGEESYYHIGSLEQFMRYTREGNAEGCANVEDTENVTPVASVDRADGFFIPHSTPFVLRGSATDANDPVDQLTYNWEQFDLGPATSINDPEGTAPTFRSVRPTADGNVRYFPRLDRVANNVLSNDEVLPAYARDMTFRMTVRDNNERAGAYDFAEVAFATTDEGPFTVNDPGPDFGDTTITWRVGDFREVRWNVAGTDQAPVLARSVNIMLSTDGGLTFDRMLAANVANTGSAFITVPDEIGESMRIVIEAVDNIFYNMNARDFSIEAAERPTYTLESNLRYANVCLPEALEAELTVGGVGGFNETVRIELGELPEGLTAELASSELTPGNSTSLSIDLSGVEATGRLVLPYFVSAPGLDTSRREIVLDITANDFSDLLPAGPAEGTEGIVLTTDFDWTDARNATTYDVQIATSPSFAEGTIFAEAGALTTTDFTPEDFFAANTLYFWRVRPINACGPGPWTEPTSFRTVASRCDTYASEDTPVSLPGSGGSFSRESKLFIDRRGTINDINLPNVRVNYQFASRVTISLTSPAGTVVTLYRENCFSTNVIDLGFDDQAPNTLTCPPDDRRVFQPVDSLMAFVGEDTFGEWTLTVAVSETNGAAGSIAGWNVEFCADAEAATPDVLVNDSTAVKPDGRARVVRQNLEIATDEDVADNTYYILTRLPARGFLELSGMELMVGDTFTQADINGERLVYENTDTSLLTDDFGFVVTTETGGYLPVSYHDIVLDAEAPNSTDGGNPLAATLELFPNPTAGDVNLRWSVAMPGEVDIQLFDLNGRVLQRQRVGLATGGARLELRSVPAGVYVVRVGEVLRRVVVR